MVIHLVHMYLPTNTVSLPEVLNVRSCIYSGISHSENVWAKERVAVRDLNLSTRLTSVVAPCPSHLTLDTHQLENGVIPTAGLNAVRNSTVAVGNQNTIPLYKDINTKVKYLTIHD